ncbi:MAG: RHS repeat-associated core domain-containing protein, partial [Candidatus Dormiibacterota bacterium]
SVPLLIQDGTTSFIYGPGGMTLEQIDGSGNPTYYLHDWQGSTLGLVNSSGAVVASYTYDAYGNLTSSSGTATTALLFQGQYRDSETGFYYLQARYYDPGTGQFLTRDPMTAATGEPYVFAADDPVNGCDPTGDLYAPAESGSGDRAATSATSAYAPGAEAKYLPASPSPSSHSTRTVSKHSSNACSGWMCGFSSFLSAAGHALSTAAGNVGHWVAHERGALLAGGAVLGLIGIACAVGMIATVGVGGVICLGAALGATALNATVTADDIQRAATGNGSWSTVGLDAIATVSAGAGIGAEPGSVGAVLWAASSAEDMQAEYEMYLHQQLGFY